VTNYDVIAIPKEQYNNPTSGEVRILFYYDPEDPNKIPKVPPKELFRSQCVWITSGYDEHISKKYSKSDSFLLTNIEPTKHTNDDIAPSRNFHDWAGRGSNVQRQNNHLIPILSCELPNKDSGIIDTQLFGVNAGIHFIKNNSKLYGPFEIEVETSEGNQNITYIATVTRPPPVAGTTHHVTVVNLPDVEGLNLIVKSEIEFGGTTEFITSLKEYGLKAKNLWEEEDYISAKNIFKLLQKVKGKDRVSLITKKTYQKIESDVSAWARDPKNKPNDNRFRRALGLLQDMQGEDPWFAVINKYIESEHGKKALAENSFLKPEEPISKEQLNDNHRELEVLNEEIVKAKNDHAEVFAKLQATDTKLSNTRNSVRIEEEKAKQQIESGNLELIAKRDELNEEINDINKTGQDLKEKYKDYTTKEELDDAIKDAKRIHNDLLGSLRTVEASISEQKRLLANPDELAASLTKVHTVMESLGYAQYSSARGGARSKPVSYEPEQTAIFETSPSASDLIVTLAERINKERGKQVSPIEVANLLICSQQHIMVFLKGRPGVGKTSTTIKFAKALGISNADFLNVPVGRGWSTSRDLLGYYNSLRGEFQPSKSGVYEFLKNGESEKATNARIILLDEANLSSIEHYWSDFIGICDPEGADRPIITGSDKDEDRFLQPNINNNLRFISTINADATVEPLSSRLLDRAPVISMELSDERGIDGKTLLFEGAISNKLLEELFGRKVPDDDDSEVSLSLEQINSFVRCGVKEAQQLGNCLYIDGRRQNNIEQYLATASRVFENDTAARDYATAQFVLPHLNCDGTGMEDAIKAMINFCDTKEWDHSKDLLEQILSSGDKYLQHYSFL
jgi:flagellar biosynthesis GTPase FlhF